MDALKVKDGRGLVGSYVVRTHRAGEIAFTRDGKGRAIADKASLKRAMQSPLSQLPAIKNLIVSSDGYGRNLLLRAMSGNSTYPIVVDSGAIGTGTTAPTDADTALETEVLDDIPAALYEMIADDALVISFFIPNVDLPDDTYNEFALYMGDQLFARSIISPDYEKGTGVDTTIEYTLTFSPA